MDKELGKAAEDSSRNVLETVTSTVGDLVTGVPAPVRKNFLKAFGALCTAAVDIPVARLEGIATEIRAQTDARVKLMSTNAEQIAGQMSVPPEYAHAAARKFGQKIVQQQINTDKVVEVAASVLQDESESSDTFNEVPKASISDDWLNNFQKEAEQVTSEEMRLLFGKVLAGEITRPSSYSIKTVRLLSQLDNQAAVAFRKFCSMCVFLESGGVIIDARVITLGKQVASDALESYGMGYRLLTILEEYGLIRPNDNSWVNYRFCIANPGGVAPLGFTYQNTVYGLVPTNGPVPTEQGIPSTPLKVYGVSLTQVGKELARVVELESNEAYTKALIQFFETKQLKMTALRRPPESQ